jgi:hypothetical protein
VKHVLYCAALMVSAFTTNAAYASAYMVKSDANAGSVTLKVGSGLLTAGAAIAPTSGVGRVYDDGPTSVAINSTTVASLGLLTIGAKITADTATSHSFASAATYGPNGMPKFTTGTEELLGAGLSLTSTLLHAVPVLGLSLSTTDLVSTATAGYNSVTGKFYTSGGANIAGLKITSGLLGLVGGSLTVADNPGMNTTIVNLATIKIILNEQISSVVNTPGGKGTTNGASMTTNAIHIYLTDFLLGGKLVTGDIILGHSFASIPEPESWAMMIMGFGLIGVALRRKGAVRMQLRRRQLA